MRPSITNTQNTMTTEIKMHLFYFPADESGSRMGSPWAYIIGIDENQGVYMSEGQHKGMPQDSDPPLI